MTAPDPGAPDEVLTEAGRALLERVQSEIGPEGSGESAAADIDTFLARVGDRVPRALIADLIVLRATALGSAGRADDALSSLTDVVDRFGEDEFLEVTQIVAFARLTQVNLLIDAERVDEAGEAAAALLATFTGQPGGEPLAGFGTMLLDVTFWMLSRERDRDALAICDALVRRLADGSAAEQAVAAGARFFAAQAAGRLGRMEESRASIQALCEVGEPALSALDRIAGQFGSAEANPTWHAQIAATSVTVLWRLGRAREAQELAHQAAESFERLGMDALAQMLAELEREVSAG